ncbi:high affinity immunoglobulin epsilon receptor subunit alpha isoform X1 [Ursus arctos]|uniref:high affinity immunoglobulin epsilon receptor subunit alpha isoform X1 n=1 Tax=Ursus arctos TaxID=9644 RepID=UPI0025471A9F|nr:high affinity immunoglobulin epsilon receptor subunit alpha isoform X1 [Ursus arctos]
MSADTSKPTVSLNPPWNRILKDDTVTLICHENNSLEVNSAVWTHNNIRLEETSSRLNIVKARIQDSGEYRCQNKDSIPSEPVYLGVFAGWLLLQASAEVVTEGESFHIRCHGWRNQNVSKVTYYRNGIALKYWYDSIDMSITNVTVRDGGRYFCTGCIRRQNHTSDPLNITVKKGELAKQEEDPWREKGDRDPPPACSGCSTQQGTAVAPCESAGLRGGAGLRHRRPPHLRALMGLLARVTRAHLWDLGEDYTRYREMDARPVKLCPSIRMAIPGLISKPAAAPGGEHCHVSD